MGVAIDVSSHIRVYIVPLAASPNWNSPTEVTGIHLASLTAMTVDEDTPDWVFEAGVTYLSQT